MAVEIPEAARTGGGRPVAARRLALGKGVGVLAGVRGTGAGLLGLLVVVVGALVLDADVLDLGSAGVGEGGG